MSRSNFQNFLEKIKQEVKDFRDLYKKRGTENNKDLRRLEKEQSRQQKRIGIITQHRAINNTEEDNKASLQVHPEPHIITRKRSPKRPPFVVGAVRHRLYSPPPAPFQKSKRNAARIIPAPNVYQKVEFNSKKIPKSDSKIPVLKYYQKNNTNKSSSSMPEVSSIGLMSSTFKSPIGIKPIFLENTVQSPEDVLKYVSMKNWFGSGQVPLHASTPIVVRTCSQNENAQISCAIPNPLTSKPELKWHNEKSTKSKTTVKEKFQEEVLETPVSNTPFLLPVNDSTIHGKSTKLGRTNRKLEFNGSIQDQESFNIGNTPLIGFIASTPRK